MLQGALQSRGIRIQRRRLRSSIERIDPIGKVLRRLRMLSRRKYQVEGPNALWLVFFILVFITEYIFRYVFFLQNVLRKACARRKLIL